MCWCQDLWNFCLHWGRSQTSTLPSWISSVLLPGTHPVFISIRTRYQKLDLIIDIIQKLYLNICASNLLIVPKLRVPNPLKKFRFRSLLAEKTLQESVKWWISATEYSRYHDSAITLYHRSWIVFSGELRINVRIFCYTCSCRTQEMRSPPVGKTIYPTHSQHLRCNTSEWHLKSLIQIKLLKKRF